MKKIVFVFAFLFSLSFQLNAQWFWQNPLPIGQVDLSSVFFLDEINAWIVGYNGIVIKTADGGMSWMQQSSGTTNTLNDVFFTDVNNGIIVGEEGTILKTTDGGSNWIQQISGITSKLNKVSFAGQLNGLIVGESGVILKTTDGGINWVSKQSGTTFDLKSVCFIDINNATVVGYDYNLTTGKFEGLILKTIDGGITWFTQFFDTNGVLQDVSFFDSSNGIAVGEYKIHRTTDGGNTWTQQPSGIALRAVHFIDSYNIFAIGYYEEGIKTTDGGLTWSTKYICNYLYGCSCIFSDLSFSKTGKGIIVGRCGIILRTYNNGVNWQEISTGTSFIFNDVHFTNTNNGTVVGYTGIYKTTNGGSNWQPTGPEYLSSISFADAMNGIIVGGGGKTLKTTDGGINWIEKPSGTDYSLNGVYFSDLLNATAVGDRGWYEPGGVHHIEGIILRSTDGGLSWSSYLTGVSARLYDVSFFNSSTGIAIGEDGKILRTTDNGNTWIQQTSGTTKLLKSIQVLDINTGIIVGSQGIILRTTNRGSTWIEYPIFSDNYSHNDVCFTDANNGTLVGGYPWIFKSTNGGVSWYTQTSGAWGLTGVSFIDANNGWVVGQGGTILHTTNGGVTFIEDEENKYIQPKEFLLQQNYPNPFNPSTNIQYAISSKQFVTLKVYDLLGKEIATLVNEEKPAGNYEINFNAPKLSSGIYFYKIQSGDFIDTKKMLLLK